MLPTRTLLRNVLVVESPSKVGSIKKLLRGTEFHEWEVCATRGHVANLSEIDTATLKPEWAYDNEKLSTLNRIVEWASEDKKTPGVVYLATDPDREGELIAKHVAAYIKTKGLKDKHLKRVSFNEVTKAAVTAAMGQPGAINDNLVDAGITRKVIDQWFGFAASNSLRFETGCRSAGRVQSPALAMVAKREGEIEKFQAEKFMQVTVAFALPGEDKQLTASLNFTAAPVEGAAAPKPTVRFNAASAEAAAALIKAAPTFSIKTATTQEQAPPPDFLDTAACLKEASKALKMKVDLVTRSLQELFEGGLITYIRTDSTTISTEAADSIRAFIRKNYGDEYALAPEEKKKAKAVKKGKVALTQEAHEAIRPTDISDKGEHLSPLSHAAKLYQWIRQRTLQAAMPRPRFAKQTITLTSKKKLNKKPLFCQVSRKEYEFLGCDVLAGGKAGKTKPLPKAPEGTAEVTVAKIKEEATKPPAHMTTMDLIDAMKKNGIGRPSTYNPTIQTLINRAYVSQNEASVLSLTDSGSTATAYVAKAFPQYVDLGYTAAMESDLDAVAKGKKGREDVLKNFRRDFGDVYAKLPRKFATHVGSEGGLNFWQTNFDRTVEMGDTGRILQVDAKTFKKWQAKDRVEKMLAHGTVRPRFFPKSNKSKTAEAKTA